MKNTEALEQLVDALRCLPGIGPKSALRMAYHLLQHDRKGASQLASSITNVLKMKKLMFTALAVQLVQEHMELQSPLLIGTNLRVGK